MDRNDALLGGTPFSIEHPANPDAVKVLTQLLAAAQRGEIVGVAVSCALRTGRTETAMGGEGALGLYYGCDKLKASLARAIEGTALVRANRMPTQ